MNKFKGTLLLILLAVGLVVANAAETVKGKERPAEAKGSIGPNKISNSEVFYNGEKLIKDIKSDDLSANAYASGFIIGVIGVNYDNREVCIDEGVTGDQLIQITKNYLEKHTDSWKYTASSILIFAVKEAYPCKK